MSVDRYRIEAAVQEIIAAIGEDPDREGLQETPRRVADFWVEFIDHDPGEIWTSFESAESDQLVIVSGIRVWSLCEHHLLPFWCDVAIGYIPDGKILGLSKLARIAKHVSHGLQVQEAMTSQIANLVEAATDSNDVAVMIKGEHLCMLMRGVKTPAVMTSSVMRGRFRDDAALRSEFLSLVK